MKPGTTLLLLMAAAPILAGCAAVAPVAPAEAPPAAKAVNAYGVPVGRERELRRQYAALVPADVLGTAAVSVESCSGSSTRQNCDYYISHRVDGCQWGSRVHATCDGPDCSYKLEPYDEAVICE